MLKSSVVVLLGVVSIFCAKGAAAYPHLLGNEVVCPVEGKQFSITEDTEIVEHGEKKYFFCRKECASSFNEDAKKYLRGGKKGGE